MKVDIFAEDRAHEEFLKPMIERIGAEEGKGLEIRVRSARGGHGRALAELRVYQESVTHGVVGMTMPDILVVAIDANCQAYARATRAIGTQLEHPFQGITVLACPDPHVERWYLADPPGFHEAVGATPRVGRRKCDKGHYKAILADTVAQAGYPPLLGGIEFAREIVERMNLHRAATNVRSLAHFIQGIRAQIRQR
jgi:hypothetical protein